MSEPLVSVVMGVYNGERNIRESIDSILSQERVDLEIIVVDDGSTDATRSILDGFAAKDVRVRVVSQQNAGLTQALIHGCSLSRGRFIARQDAGDTSLPGRLVRQASALEADPSLSFVSCWAEMKGPGGEFLYTVKGSRRAEQPIEVLDPSLPKGVIDGPSHHGSVVFRRDLFLKVGGYRQQFYYGQDWDLWYRLAEVGRFQMIAEVLYVARFEPQGISGESRDRQESLARLSREALQLRLAGKDERIVLEQAAMVGRSPTGNRPSRANYFVGECLRQNGDPRASAYLREALRQEPFLVRAWVRLAQIRILGSSPRGES